VYLWHIYCYSAWPQYLRKPYFIINEYKFSFPFSSKKMNIYILSYVVCWMEYLLWLWHIQLFLQVLNQPIERRNELGWLFETWIKRYHELNRVQLIQIKCILLSSAYNKLLDYQLDKLPWPKYSACVYLDISLSTNKICATYSAYDLTS
jgi:hypothetical protein